MFVFFLAASVSQLLVTFGQAGLPQDQHLQLEQTFKGPGRLICDRGECAFDVQYDKLCHDACNTKCLHDMREYGIKGCSSSGEHPFSMLPYIQMSYAGPRDDDALCYHNKASNITTTYDKAKQYEGYNRYNPPGPIEIKDGCTAKCTGCTFLAPFNGPGQLGCVGGECTVTSGGKDACNAKDFIKTPGIDYEMSSSTNTWSIRHVKNVTTKNPIDIHAGCNLECQGCTFNEFPDTFEGEGYLECIDKGKCIIPDSKCPKLHEAMTRVSSRWDFKDALHITVPGSNQNGRDNQYEWALGMADLESIIHYGIITPDPLKIPGGCKIKCSGCSYTKELSIRSDFETEAETLEMIDYHDWSTPASRSELIDSQEAKESMSGRNFIFAFVGLMCGITLAQLYRLKAKRYREVPEEEINSAD